jgi:hypothetical protein
VKTLSFWTSDDGATCVVPSLEASTLETLLGRGDVGPLPWLPQSL